MCKKFSGLQIQSEAKIGFGTKIFIGNKGRLVIGQSSYIGADTTICANSHIEIGKNTLINKSSRIGCAEFIRIGRGVMIAHGVSIYDNNNHPVNFESRYKIAEHRYTSDLISWEKSKKKPIEIGDYVWIGMHSIILKGVNIGRGSIVAAGSVVVHNVPEMTIVGGNPAQVVKYLS